MLHLFARVFWNTLWLELLLQSEILSQQQFDSLYADCLELKKLFVSITNKTKQNLGDYNLHEDVEQYDFLNMEVEFGDLEEWFFIRSYLRVL